MTQGHSATVEDLDDVLSKEAPARRWTGLLAMSGAVAMAISAGVIYRTQHRPQPPARFVTESIERGDVVERVQATGAAQPMLEVNVGAQVNGRVMSVLVDFNSVVKKGDVLAEIDPTIYGTQVSAQTSNVQQQRAQLWQIKAQMDAARTQMQLAKTVHDRTKKLNEQSLASQADLEAARGQYDLAKANYQGATAAVAAARAAIGSQSAQLSQLETNLAYTKIYSPVDGVVVSRNIDPGATVVASFQAPVLFVIAQDLKKMRVMADIDEADVGKLDVGMAADVVVDAFPGEAFRGSVHQVRYFPNNNSGVVTYSAVVEVANPDEKLRPGMTATVSIVVGEAKNALVVPNSALRFVLPEDEAKAAKTPLEKGQGRVYVVSGDRPLARIVSLGLTDGVSTEVRDAALPEGAKIIADEAEAPKKESLF